MALRHAPFVVESRLLEELGERLVSGPEVALVELIKNSYDADANECRIDYLPQQNALQVVDDGHGITETQFRERWMTIATSYKKEERFSPKYGRNMSGAKGIGRFAARFLGDRLTLITTARAEEGTGYTRLKATFDWDDVATSKTLDGITIPYEIENLMQGETGVALCIEKLRLKFDENTFRSVRTGTLHITSPLTGLDSGGMIAKRRGKKSEDPGFSVFLGDTSEDKDANLARNVLDNYVVRLRLSVKNNKWRATVNFADSDEPTFDETFYFSNKIGSELYADIRHFPQRAGVFSQKGFDGRAAWKWVRENSGVKVVDHGFLVRPYGFHLNDWLWTDLDGARNHRDWRSSIMKEHFALSSTIRSSERANPMLYLPMSHQLVGAVFVNSSEAAEKRAGLIPNMDREGFVENEGYNHLWDAVRAGVELIAFTDKREQDRKKEEEAKEARKAARGELKATIKAIEEIRTIPKSDKARLVTEYTKLYKNIDFQEEYDRRAREQLETVSLLGVVAGFMVHEHQRIFDDLENLVETIASLSKKNKVLLAPLESLQSHLDKLRKYMTYTKEFIGGAGMRPSKLYRAKHQIQRLLDYYGEIASSRNINVSINIEDRVEAPLVSPAAYSGIALNLFTNALKAHLSSKKYNAHPIVEIRAWNDDKWHYLSVLDNGPGIPEELRRRIWDPLFTTTGIDSDNPLGTGMGLGLPLVKRLVESLGGYASLEKSPITPFSTCFLVRLPRG